MVEPEKSVSSEAPRASPARVAFIFHSPFLGGAERALLSVLQHLPQGRIDPLIVFPAGIDGPIRRAAEETLKCPVFEAPYHPHIPAESSPIKTELLLAEKTVFASLFRNLSLDAVVLNTTVLLPGTIAAAELSIPFIVHSHGLITDSLFPGLAENRWLRFEAAQVGLAARIIVPSEWVANYYNATYRLPLNKVRVIPNGVLMPSPETSAVVPQPNAPRFAMLCTLEPNKGAEVFITAAASLLRQNPDGAYFEIFGAGHADYVWQLNDLVWKMGIADRFSILPKQTDVASIYKSTTAVIIASRSESFSMVTLEAMSHGRPVISTRCGGPQEIIEDERTGLLFDVGDVSALCRNMRRLIDDPDFGRELGTNARASVESRFDILRVASAYEQCISDVADEDALLSDPEKSRSLLSVLDLAGEVERAAPDRPASDLAGARTLAPRLEALHRYMREENKQGFDET